MHIKQCRGSSWTLPGSSLCTKTGIGSHFRKKRDPEPTLENNADLILPNFEIHLLSDQNNRIRIRNPVSKF